MELAFGCLPIANEKQLGMNRGNRNEINVRNDRRRWSRVNGRGICKEATSQEANPKTGPLREILCGQRKINGANWARSRRQTR